MNFPLSAIPLFHNANFSELCCLNIFYQLFASCMAINHTAYLRNTIEYKDEAHNIFALTIKVAYQL